MTNAALPGFRTCPRPDCYRGVISNGVAIPASHLAPAEHDGAECPTCRGEGVFLDAELVAEVVGETAEERIACAALAFVRVAPHLWTRHDGRVVDTRADARETVRVPAAVPARRAPAVPRLRRKVVGVLRGSRLERALALSVLLARLGVNPSRRPANEAAAQ